MELAACGTGEVGTPSDDDTQIGPIEIETASGELASADEEEPSICSALPSCDLCSHVCDPEGLAPFLPPETCAAILCTLTDGREVTVHACHH